MLLLAIHRCASIRIKQKRVEAYDVQTPIPGSIPLSIIVSVYILLVLNHTFWTKTFSIMAGQNVAIAAFVLAMTAAFIALFVSFSVKYLMKPLLILFIVSAASGAWFMDQFGAILDDDMFRNAVETNTAEASHLITTAFCCTCRFTQFFRLCLSRGFASSIATSSASLCETLRSSFPL